MDGPRPTGLNTRKTVGNVSTRVHQTKHTEPLTMVAKRVVKTYRITYKKNSRKREYACPPNQTHRTINHGCKTSGKDEHIRSPGTCVITRTLNLCFTYFPIVLFLENFVSFLNLDLCLLQQQLHCFTKRDIAGEGVEEVSKVARDCLMVK